MIKMLGYGTRLEALGFPIPVALGTDLLLASLPLSYSGFIMNYNMNGMDKSTNELLAMLKTAEAGMQKDTNHVMMVSKTTSFKKKGKAKRARAPVRPTPRKSLKVAPLLTLGVSSARRRATERGTAKGTWQKGRNLESPAEV